MKLIQVKLLEQIERIKATGIFNQPETISEKFAKRSGTVYKIHSVSIVSNPNEHPIVRSIAALSLTLPIGSKAQLACKVLELNGWMVAKSKTKAIAQRCIASALVVSVMSPIMQEESNHDYNPLIAKN